MLVIYIHGFLSSPKSAKAVVTQRWLEQHRSSWRFECPHLSPHPANAVKALERLMIQNQDTPIGLIGSSLGGFWANVLVERFEDCKAVLVNPAISPHILCKQRVGQTLKNYHTQDTYTLDEQDVETFIALSPKVTKPHRYWLLTQQGDETLDYRHAVAKFDGCRQTVLPGGSHAFDDYESWLPQIAEYLSSSDSSK